ncbi:hypothetical protein OG474_00785 [Kribbella sp. NBC_01505]|uniref:hypothetical protein n=1 Tax=Kribbella sp. NBC_01505 TaxID=2903580 RepID=UPI00386DDC1C
MSSTDEEVAERRRIDDLYRQGREHEMRCELLPARRFLEQALVAASAIGLTVMIRKAEYLLGVVSHKENNLPAARRHLETGLAMALATGDREAEAYARQEVGFLFLGEGHPGAAHAEFLQVLGLAPGVGIINLTGNGLSGLGVAFLANGKAPEAVPLLLGALGIRTEITDLEQQHVDLVHLAHAALLLGHRTIAARVTGFLACSQDTRLGMYPHDRRTFAGLVSAVGTSEAATGFEEARALVAALTEPAVG